MKKLILLFVCALVCVGVNGANKWPKKPLGSNEKLFYGEQRIQEIRQKIDSYEWAAELYQTMQDNIEIGLNEGTIADQYKASVGGSPIWRVSGYYRDMALYYRISGDEKYMPELIDYIVSSFQLDKPDKVLFSDKVSQNHNLWTWLMFKMRLFHAYDLIKTHPDMRQYEPIMNERLKEIVSESKRYTTYMRHAGNTQFWVITMGLGVSAMLLDDVETFKDALYNDYYGAEAILSSFKDGGKARLEPPLYYYGYVTSCLTILFEIADFNDIADMYNYKSANGNNLETLVEGFIDMSYPDGTLMSHGDGTDYYAVVGNRAVIFGAKLFDNDEYTARELDKWEIYNRAYDNPKFAWILSRNPKRDGLCEIWGYSALTHGVGELGAVETPLVSSEVFHTEGSALLKSVEGADYWDSDAITVLVRAGATLINHNHSDHLHIKMNAFDSKPIYTDWVHYYDYISPRKANNYADQTPLSPRVLAHNTVAVDCSEPKISNIKFSDIDRSSDGAQVFSAYGTPYKGVDAKRTICLTKDYVIDVFELESDTVHTYDFILNSLGVVTGEGIAESYEYKTINEDYKLKAIDKWAKKERNAWIQDARRAKVSEDNVRVIFRDSDNIGAVATTLCDDEQPTELILANTPTYVAKMTWDGSLENSGFAQLKPLSILRRECSSTTFYTVHYPFKDVAQRVAITKEGDVLSIVGEDFVDTFDVSTNKYKRESNK